MELRRTLVASPEDWWDLLLLLPNIGKNLSNHSQNKNILMIIQIGNYNLANHRKALKEELICIAI